MQNNTQEKTLDRDQITLQVLIIWQYTLQSDYDVDKDSDFFAVGGDSLQAVEIVANIKNIFNVELPLSSFIDAPTPTLQAKLLLSQDLKSKWKIAVALKPTGNKSPFFCVHPVGGNILCYTKLAASMGEDFPFYGLQAIGLYGGDKPISNIKEIACHYINSIQNIQPHGPYHIGGWSAGGIIAFEIAQQLNRMGEDTNLILIDTHFPGIQTKLENTSPALSDKQPGKLISKFYEPPLPEGYQQAAMIQSKLTEGIARYKTNEHSGNIALLLCDNPDIQNQTSIVTRIKRKIAINILKPHNKLTQYLLKRRPPDHPLNWYRIAKGKFEIFLIPGGHTSILDENNCTRLAQYIMRCIDS